MCDPEHLCIKPLDMLLLLGELVLRYEEREAYLIVVRGVEFMAYVRVDRLS